MTATSKPFLKYFRKKSLDLATTAALKCLKAARLNPKFLDMLVYTGIYRDEHMVEPAIAALIQKKVGANPVANGNNTTFSFDLNNGGCGLISGMQLVDGFIQSGTIRQGMVVTSDAEPYQNLSQSYRFVPSAGAMILSSADNGTGFKKFKHFTFPQYKNTFESYISWTSLKKNRKKRNVLLVSQKENYLDLCVQCAIESLMEFLHEAQLKLSEIDLIIPSQSPGKFAAKLTAELDLPDKIVDVACSGGELHTAGLAVALEKVIKNGCFEQAKNVVFLTVGSGITTAFALYKNQNNGKS